MNSACSSKFSNPKSRGPLYGGSLTCYHGLPAQLRIAKRGTRPRNKFYSCAKWPVSAQNSEIFFNLIFSPNMNHT